MVASHQPVWMLLQPRDYINGQPLLVALFVIFLGVLVGWDTISAPAINEVALNSISAPAINEVALNSPSSFPYRCITVACGAISCFHSLVGSGTRYPSSLTRNPKRVSLATAVPWVRAH